MKNVIIRNLHAVGMHRDGPRELPVGPMHYCKLEADNPYHRNAIAVFENEGMTRRRAYLKREEADKGAVLFRQNCIHGKC